MPRSSRVSLPPRASEDEPAIAQKDLDAIAAEYRVQPIRLASLLAALRRLAVDCPTCTVDAKKKVVRLREGGEEKWDTARDRFVSLARALGRVEEALGDPFPPEWLSGRPEAERLFREALLGVDTERRLDQSSVDAVYALRECFEQAAQLRAVVGRQRKPAWHVEACRRIRSFWRRNRPADSDKPYFRAADVPLRRRKTVRDKFSGERKRISVDSYPEVPSNAYSRFVCAVTAHLWRWSHERSYEALKRLRTEDRISRR